MGGLARGDAARKASVEDGVNVVIPILLVPLALSTGFADGRER
jgi:hypothetical protein